MLIIFKWVFIIDQDYGKKNFFSGLVSFFIILLNKKNKVLFNLINQKFFYIFIITILYFLV